MKLFKVILLSLFFFLVISVNAQTASFTIPSTAFVGEVVIADGTASSGINGQVGWSTKPFSNGTSAVFWDFGDNQGTYSTPRHTLRVSHIFMSTGTYTISLLVKNSAGTSNSISHSITISNIPAATGGNVQTLADQGSNSLNCIALQGAIDTAYANNATTEREIALPVITYTCTITIPTSVGNKYVTIRPASTSFLPSSTDRINPTSHAASMPKILSPGVDQTQFDVPPGRKYLRLLGIEFDKQAGHIYQLLTIGTGVNSYSNLPHHIIIDRCYFKGNPFDSTGRGIYVSADSFSIINSYIRDMHDTNADAQAIAGFAGTGIGIYNNYLNGLGENVMFGGSNGGINFQTTVSGAGTSTSATLVSVANLRVGDGISFLVSGTRGPWSASIVRSISGNNVTFDAITNSVGVITAPDTTTNGVKYGSSPQDILVARNYLFKSLIYRVVDPSYNGSYGPVVKNSFELKHGMRVIVDGNIIENHWGNQGQAGPTVLFTPRNQTCYLQATPHDPINCPEQINPWVMVRDVQFTNNKLKNIGDFINVMGADNLNPIGTGDESGPSAFTQYIVVENNIIDRVDPTGLSGSNGDLIFIWPGVKTLTVNHNTQINLSGNRIVGAYNNGINGDVSNDVLIINNIMKHLTYGITGDKGNSNTLVINAFTNGFMIYNVISDDENSIGPNAETWTTPRTMPNDFPATINTNTFIDMAAGNYKLKSTSPYKAGSSSPAADGTDKGVDFDVVSMSTANSTIGIFSGSASPTPTPTPNPSPTPTPTPTPSSLIKIWTANVNHGQGTDGATNFSRQSTVLIAKDPDIVFLQERTTNTSISCSPCTDSEWNATMTGYNEQVYRENDTGQGDGPSIWTKPTVTTLQTYQHDLSNGAIGWDGSTNVDKAVVGIKATINGKTGFFFNTHLAWSAGADCNGCQTSTIRVNQINELLSWINTVVGSDPNWIVGGDMNLSPTMPKSPSGFQIDLFTNAGLSNTRALAVANAGSFILNWGDRDSDGTPDMLGSNPITHDTREIDYFFIRTTATRFAFQSLEIADNRATCSTALTGTPKFCPDITDPSLRWGNSGDFGVRPSDHNWLLLTLTTDIAPPSGNNKKCNWHTNPSCEP